MSNDTIPASLYMCMLHCTIYYFTTCVYYTIPYESILFLCTYVYMYIYVYTGEYRKVTKRGVDYMSWNCCHNSDPNAIGCRKQPHQCKEMMISIRAEANPTIRVDNIDMIIIQKFELSFFPGASYDLKLRITRNIIEVLHCIVYYCIV